MQHLSQPSSRLRRGAGAAAVAALAAVAGISPALASAAPQHAATTYHFRTLNNNRDKTFNQLLGINNEGLIVGYFGSGAKGHPNKGYRLRPPYHQGNYTSENFPGGKQTQVTGLNDTGVTVGFWSTQNKANEANNNLGFYFRGGHYHEVNFPAQGTASPPIDQLLGVNDSDLAVGFYVNKQDDSRGYTYNIKSGRFGRVLLPGLHNLSRGVSLTATAINDAGTIAGFYTVNNGNPIGFVKTAGGHVTKLTVKKASVQPFGINDSGEVVGTITTGSGNSAVTDGFTWTRAHGFKKVDDPKGIGTTLVNGVNDHGDLVGFYTDAAGNVDGFLAVP
jgi:copper(I)-binding protein